MKTEVNALKIFCYCMFFIFVSCQKDNILPDITIVEQPEQTEENYLEKLSRDLPDNMIITAVKETTKNTETPPLTNHYHQTDSLDTDYYSCYNLRNIYIEMHREANFNCRVVRRQVCCHDLDKYKCLIIQVLPSSVCPDSLRLPQDLKLDKERILPVLKDR
jgi:hypothetical protein